MYDSSAGLLERNSLRKKLRLRILAFLKNMPQEFALIGRRYSKPYIEALCSVVGTQQVSLAEMVYFII